MKLFISMTVLALFAGTNLRAESSHPLVLGMGPLKYVIDPAKFQVGYSVHALQTGRSIGTFYTQSRANFGDEPFGDMNSALERDGTESNAVLAAAETDSADTLAHLKGVSSPEASGRKSTESETLIKFDAFDIESCLRSALELAKVERQVTSGTREARQLAVAIALQIEETRGAGGLYCTRGDKRLNEIVILDEIERIKFYSSILLRTKMERERLIDTARLAFTPGYDAELLIAWREIWRRLAVAAVLEFGPLPEWTSVMDQLERRSPLVDLKEAKGNFRIDVRPAEIDFRRQMQRGLTMLGVLTNVQ